MTKATERRRTQFLKALAAANQSQSAWARSVGISKAQLSLVLNGHRESLRLTSKIDAFILEHAGAETTAIAS